MAGYGEGNIVALIGVTIGWIGLGSVMLLLRASRAGARDNAEAKRDASSLVGLALQSAGIFAVFCGATHIARDLSPAVALAGASALALAMAGLALFVWSAATMGANWRLVARTRDAHELVERGPFKFVRHPIYVALFLLLIASAKATGHLPNLLVAVPLYVIGTLSRVSVEERLLRDAFGQRYEDYAQRVKRFVPGLV
ncbi:MAG: isoprenylcysteine carboxylmethyltransferase family protein [Terricaulis sp.]